MALLVLGLALVPGVIGIFLLVTIAIERFSAKPEESKIRNAVNLTCKQNGIIGEQAKLWAAIVFLVISIGLSILGFVGTEWDGIGKTLWR